MKTENLKDAFKRLILSDADDPADMLTEVKQHLAAMTPSKTISLHRGKVKSVKKVRKAENEYVYDIGMRNELNPWFFGNNILVHNSVYFSAWPVIQEDVELGRMEWNKDICVRLYDSIADQVNLSFPKFMKSAFHCTEDQGAIIKGGRESVSAAGLFIKKKRYAILMYELEGDRLDVEGRSGKVKAMGLDLRRSDTPKVVQEFLSDILKQVLDGAEKQQIITAIRAFKQDFKTRPPWEKGTPKRVNKLTYYGSMETKHGRFNMPGHVRAAINWNNLRRMHSDARSLEVVDGMKTIVCKLKPNPLGLTSIGYPTDEMRLPQWFKDMPFDAQEMEDTIVTQKVQNLLGVLNWDLQSATDIKTQFNNLFDF